MKDETPIKCDFMLPDIYEEESLEIEAIIMTNPIASLKQALKMLIIEPHGTLE